MYLIETYCYAADALLFVKQLCEDWLISFWRHMEPIGNIPPAEAEVRYNALLEGPAIAA